MISHAVAVLLMVFFVYTASPGTSELFPWHPTCMAISYLFLIIEGVLLFSPESIMHLPSLNPWRITFHWMAQGLAVILGLLGSSAIFIHKELLERPHWVSWHGIMGSITTTIMLFVATGGWTAKLAPRLGIKNANDIKYLHGMAGGMTAILGLFTVTLGMQSFWFSKRVTGSLWGICLGAVGFLGLVIGNHIIKCTMTRRQLSIFRKK